MSVFQGAVRGIDPNRPRTNVVRCYRSEVQRVDGALLGNCSRTEKSGFKCTAIQVVERSPFVLGFRIIPQKTKPKPNNTTMGANVIRRKLKMS